MTYFNPRPPRGGRRDDVFPDTTIAQISIHALREEGDGSRWQLPCTRRTISIHALREEGDRQRCCKVQRFLHFNPRPPRGGRHFELVHPQSQSKFQSTPSARRATFSRSYRSTYSQFQSTPSARRATVFIGIHRTGHGISIHALREEGDQNSRIISFHGKYFNPRPPRGGRPCPLRQSPDEPAISIHALREEGDCALLS